MKETHHGSSLLALVKIVVASQHKRDNETNLCQDFLTTEKHRLGLESPSAALCKSGTCTRQTFCKLAEGAETIRNYQKQVLVMIKHFLGNLQINSILE